MEIFLDTANIEEIRKGVAWGIVDGVTTNPTLVSKENAVFEERIKEICETVEGPVSAEVVSTDYEGMVKEAREIANLSEFVVVKIPLIPDGIKAIKTLSKEGIKTNATLVFSPLQALLAAKAGATYVSPFIGRMDDIGNTGMDIVEEIEVIFSNYGYETKIIVASVRHPQHVLEAGLIGADVVTMPFEVLEKMFKHPMTDIGLERFLNDWKKYQDYLKSKNN
ncbi:transaldolase [Petrotoga mobilis SJ95]|jgi:transaldolase|uniref:Probable transaldolase n=1 Tax=Petrotoga mobilis (strain DSM 10674 / SJ95) TaxID=403833 RepID=TAL_PETMO|nr:MULTISPECIES: fructose-6-phosphate aldolase [Petrotoga]A9BHK7.1 RecName: Full=Probable transaldolase [Petrotoga mobilis SJ95]ABX31879.1 transaldolase [Petrotoga mobilis SJ95]PNR90260.1 transaldolase [Petrotoga sp. 9T1HF07.CasAA.8.2]PNR93255.1 transaldolase [Petrotoga sp. HWHPT.55.6.3]RLL89998.1 transaldolase [Petrotoga sp. HKA.pet.4.5]RPD36711.1 transaldolase [Petrotoga sp. HWH.PT.55.6.1]